MTINVDTVIPVPADTDNYQLVLDLTTMRNAIVDSLNDVIVELGQRPETGSAASFYSVTCVSTGRFGTSVTIDPIDSGNPVVISNAAATFGISKSGVGGLSFSGGKWISTSPIQIVDGVAGQDAASRNHVAAVGASLQANINTVQSNVDALEAKTVVRYNGNQQWAPNANYATSAGTAAYATSAGSAPVGSHTHDYAPSAYRPEVHAGTTGAYNLSGYGTANITIPLPYADKYPHSITLTCTDINGDEVFASVRAGWTNSASCPVRLKNVSSRSETVRVMWTAVYA